MLVSRARRHVLGMGVALWLCAGGPARAAPVEWRMLRPPVLKVLGQHVAESFATLLAWGFILRFRP